MSDTGNPTLNDLKALSVALPPSDRLSSGEVADVLSGLVAVVTHGRAILDAAQDGSNGVLDFLHQRAVDHAEENGHPVPERGNVPVEPGQPQPTQQAAIDYNKLAAAIVRAQSASAGVEGTEESSVAPSDSSTTDDTSVATGSDPGDRGII